MLEAQVVAFAGSHLSPNRRGPQRIGGGRSNAAEGMHPEEHLHGRPVSLHSGEPSGALVRVAVLAVAPGCVARIVGIVGYTFSVGMSVRCGTGWPTVMLRCVAGCRLVRCAHGTVSRKEVG